MDPFYDLSAQQLRRLIKDNHTVAPHPSHMPVHEHSHLPIAERLALERRRLALSNRSATVAMLRASHTGRVVTTGSAAKAAADVALAQHTGLSRFAAYSAAKRVVSAAASPRWLANALHVAHGSRPAWMEVPK